MVFFSSLCDDLVCLESVETRMFFQFTILAFDLYRSLLFTNSGRGRHSVLVLPLRLGDIGQGLTRESMLRSEFDRVGERTSIYFAYGLS